MARTGTIVSLAIALSAFFLLLKFGFAIWVFLPLLPAGILFVAAVRYGRRRATKPQQTTDADTKPPKAA